MFDTGRIVIGFTREYMRARTGRWYYSVYKQLSPFSPADIFNSLSEHVVGQDQVKVALSVGMYKHQIGMKFNQNKKVSKELPVSAVNDALLDRRALEGFGLHESQKREYLSDSQSLERDAQKNYDHSNNNFPSSIGLKSGKVVPHQTFGKTNILIMGPTGTGKTLLAQSLADMIGVPMVITDATSLTQAGYVGDDVESVLAKLYLRSGYDLGLAERGIVYIDEIDKISCKNSGPNMPRDVSGEGVQQGLLKLLEGTEVSIPKVGLKQKPGGDTVLMDTSRILFICAGSFAGIEDIINKRLERESNDNHNTSTMKKVLNIDLIKFGLIPEFIGRFSVITATDHLTTVELADIIHKPKGSLLKQYEYFFALHHIELIITPDACHTIAEFATLRGTGARGLRSILEEILTPVMFYLPDKISSPIIEYKGSGQQVIADCDEHSYHTALVNRDVVVGKSGVLLLRGDLSAADFLASKVSTLGNDDDRIVEVKLHIKK